MSKFDEAMTDCRNQMAEAGIACDAKLLSSIAKGLGPSLYNRNANLVAASDDTEVANVKARFVSRKLGVEGPEADAAIAHAIEQIGPSNRQKLRPVFYYLIVRYLQKEAVYE